MLGLEHRLGGDLVLHRWCQWISKFHPGGVYEAENEKLPDFNESLPRYVKEQVIKPAVRAGKVVVILGEEWHTAEALSRLSEMLLSDGLRSRVVMFWNANNTYSFRRIDWLRLKRAATITTVSRYMKQILWQQGVSPIVIPNGVPKWLLCEDHDKEASQFRRLFDADLLMSKIARWDHTKGWKTAIETMELLKCRGLKAILLLRGGTEPYGEEVIEKARGLGLVIRDAKPSNGSKVGFLAALSEAARDHVNVVNIRFPLPLESLAIVYRASDAVLANSSHEPFGLAGLEAMASGGVAITGSTGEEYAVHLVNALVLDGSDPQELEAHLMYLRNFPDESLRIRAVARETARHFTWESVVRNLLNKIEIQAVHQGALNGKDRD